LGIEWFSGQDFLGKRLGHGLYSTRIGFPPIPRRGFLMAQWLQPVVKRMILCSDVLPGPAGTGNVHLMNVFQAIRPRSLLPFPYHLAELCVFLQLTDAEGEAPGFIVGRHVDSDQIVFTSEEHVIPFRDRHQVKGVLFRLKNRCLFPEPGLYCIEFHCDGRWVMEQTLTLVG
jgi:hypothetical protein